MTVFDAYEIRARLAPALVVASPLVLIVVALVQASTSTFLTTSAGAVVFVTLLYTFSFLVRHLGRRVENELWTTWGGPPSATVLREADTTFSVETKSRIRSFLASTLGITGTDDPGWGDNVDGVQEAFRLVRQNIRQQDPKGLWFTHNAEYGFLRNLLGSWWLLVLNSIVAVGISGVLWYAHGGKPYIFLAALSLAFALASVFGRIAVLPSAVQTAATRYAESAWTSFLANAQEAASGQTGSKA